MQPQIIRGQQHDTVCNLILRALREDGCIKCTREEIRCIERAANHGSSLFTKLSPGYYKLNLTEALRVSHVVSGKAWRALGDPYCRRMASRSAQGKSIIPRDKWKGTRKGKDAPVKGKAQEKQLTDNQELPDWQMFFSKEE